ncbi:MAG: hypothetical protein ACTSR3_23390 [Candidatus Helarchaeota archaeon]
MPSSASSSAILRAFWGRWLYWSYRSRPFPVSIMTKNRLYLLPITALGGAKGFKRGTGNLRSLRW